MEKLGLETMLDMAPTPNIQERISITDRELRAHDKVCCCVSGGADSDFLMHLVWNLDTDGKVEYWFCDTGLEMQATKNHLRYLENAYGVKINVAKPTLPCAASVVKNGYPFLAKKTSDYIHRLQIHDFNWTDDDAYRMPVSARKFWTNTYIEGAHKMLLSEIGSIQYLKEFMMENPPSFKISEHCCFDCKKQPMHKVQKRYDLVLTGVRRAEGGARSSAYKSCTVSACSKHNYDLHMPLFWWNEEDRDAYHNTFGIVHSEAYTVYGFKRTGCAGCPFNSKFEEELSILDKYEPKLSMAVRKIFEPSYEYMRAFREYKAIMKEKSKQAKAISKGGK